MTEIEQNSAPPRGPPSISFIIRTQPRGLHPSPTSSRNGTFAAFFQFRCEVNAI
jgi:hypothetical protein